MNVLSGNRLIKIAERSLQTHRVCDIENPRFSNASKSKILKVLGNKNQNLID